MLFLRRFVVPRSDYSMISPCKTCGRFSKCPSRTTRVASCDKYRQATVKELEQQEESTLSVKVVVK